MLHAVRLLNRLPRQMTLVHGLAHQEEAGLRNGSHEYDGEGRLCLLILGSGLGVCRRNNASVNAWCQCSLAGHQRNCHGSLLAVIALRLGDVRHAGQR
jgi:hypothetical protein